VIFVLASLLMACTGSVQDRSPPPLDKHVLLGKWEEDDLDQFGFVGPGKMSRNDCSAAVIRGA
jgi:hypothetical protein